MARSLLLLLCLPLCGQAFLSPTRGRHSKRGIHSSLEPFEEVSSPEDSGEGDANDDDEELKDRRAVLYQAEDEYDCLPPGAVPQTRLVFLISDATGVTARSTLLKTLAQFDTCADDAPMQEEETFSGQMCDVRTRTFTFIRSTSALTQIMETAKEKNACVMYTLADPQLRREASKRCQLLSIVNCDLMGPSLDVLSGFLDREPLGIPSRIARGSRRRALGDSYYQRMDAVEYCLKADDGQSPWLLSEADIVLVGVSRSGKTPLSVVLAQTMALKVANIPLVVDIPPPHQLLDSVDPKRIFCLTISPTELRRIRTTRLERRNVKKIEAKYESVASTRNTSYSSRSSSTISHGSSSGQSTSNYADRAYLQKDLQNARKLAEMHEWTEVDVTGRAVEETATFIVELYNERFGDHLSPNSLR